MILGVKGLNIKNLKVFLNVILMMKFKEGCRPYHLSGTVSGSCP